MKRKAFHLVAEQNWQNVKNIHIVFDPATLDPNIPNKAFAQHSLLHNTQDISRLLPGTWSTSD